MFSVIIPAHNRARTLSNTLAGVCAAARGHEVEVIVVDNHSTTEPPGPVIADFAGQIPITLLKQNRNAPSFSLCRARNMAAACAVHDYVVFLDGDCVPCRRYFDVAAQHVAPDRILVGIRRFIREIDIRQPRLAAVDHLPTLPQVRSVSNYALSVDRRLRYLPHLSESPHPWGYCHGGNLVMPRAQVCAVRYDEAYDGCWGYEDVDFAFRAIRSGNEAVYVPGMDAYHQEHPGEDPNTMVRKDKAQNPNWLRICAQIPGFEAHKRAEFRDLGAQVRSA